MNRFVDNLARGFFDQSRLLVTDDDVGKLEYSLNEMADAISAAVEKLENERDQRESVLTSMGEGVVVLNRQGTVILANKKSSELFSIPLKGKNITEISRDPKLLSLIETVREKWSSVSDEVDILESKDVMLHVTVSPLVRNMQMLGSVLVLHDITMLKKLETMRKDFVANVSHELKTPLTSIGGFSETLINGGLDDKENALKFVSIIKNNTDRLSRLVEDLLTLSNIELGKITFNVLSLDPAGPARNVESTLGPLALAKGLELNVKMKDGLKVKADKDRLEQVLMNLVDNAIKFTNEGAVTLSAEMKGSLVEITVSDTGSGVPTKDLSRLGERFYRVDPARSRELGGTGLGLAIVKHLVTSMGGTLAFESVEGEGTTVCFSLPAA